jgi:GNAT superfamily N-acetyltransferase
MSEQPLLDEAMESGQWPQEFEGAWMDITFDNLSGDTVASLYFNATFDSGHINVNEDRLFRSELPSAYVSWMRDGTCREIFVHPDFRRRGIGTMICVFARSYAYQNQGLVFSAPGSMTESARLLYSHISDSYGEPFGDPENYPPGVPYAYWGGYFV